MPYPLFSEADPLLYLYIIIIVPYPLFSEADPLLYLYIIIINLSEISINTSVFTDKYITLYHLFSDIPDSPQLFFSNIPEQL